MARNPYQANLTVDTPVASADYGALAMAEKYKAAATALGISAGGEAAIGEYVRQKNIEGEKELKALQDKAINEQGMKELKAAEKGLEGVQSLLAREQTYLDVTEDPTLYMQQRDGKVSALQATVQSAQDEVDRRKTAYEQGKISFSEYLSGVEALTKKWIAAIPGQAPQIRAAVQNATGISDADNLTAQSWLKSQFDEIKAKKDAAASQQKQVSDMVKKEAEDLVKGGWYSDPLEAARDVELAYVTGTVRPKLGQARTDLQIDRAQKRLTESKETDQKFNNLSADEFINVHNAEGGIARSKVLSQVNTWANSDGQKFVPTATDKADALNEKMVATGAYLRTRAAEYEQDSLVRRENFRAALIKKGVASDRITTVINQMEKDDNDFIKVLKDDSGPSVMLWAQKQSQEGVQITSKMLAEKSQVIKELSSIPGFKEQWTAYMIDPKGYAEKANAQQKEFWLPMLVRFKDTIVDRNDARTEVAKYNTGGGSTLPMPTADTKKEDLKAQAGAAINNGQNSLKIVRQDPTLVSAEHVSNVTKWIHTAVRDGGVGLEEAKKQIGELREFAKSLPEDARPMFNNAINQMYNETLGGGALAGSTGAGRNVRKDMQDMVEKPEFLQRNMPSAGAATSFTNNFESIVVKGKRVSPISVTLVADAGGAISYKFEKNPEYIKHLESVTAGGKGTKGQRENLAYWRSVPMPSAEVMLRNRPGSAAAIQRLNDTSQIIAAVTGKPVNEVAATLVKDISAVSEPKAQATTKQTKGKSTPWWK